MGTVPEAYFQFVMHYAPYVYVIPSTLGADAAEGQKNVTLNDASSLLAGYPVKISDNLGSEWNTVSSIAGSIVTMENNLQNTYHTAGAGKVEGPQASYARGVMSASFALEFLCQAYSNSQYSSQQSVILAKITELVDWILTQQCVNSAKKAYGGFKSAESSTVYYSIDAGRCIPALLKAYSLTKNMSYLNGAKLAATFLYTMQQAPFSLAVTDKYYGGFSQYVNDADAFGSHLDVENLYCLIGLKMLADTYDTAQASLYYQMMADAVDCFRTGLEQCWLYFDPPPYGDGTWHRVGLSNNEVYDDPIAFALLGLYTYEGWSPSCRRVYNFIQSIRASGSYPAYIPNICWPGYIDVVTRVPACNYYDGVTIGILWKIRKEQDAPSYKLAHDIAWKYCSAFLFWGPLFTDYSPLTPSKAMANVSWLAQMFLNYEEPKTQFTRILKSNGENVLLYSVRQAVDKTDYAEPLEILSIVSALKAEEILIEPGYYLEDYLAFYTFLPVRSHDKIRRQGQDYEVQTSTPFALAKPLYFKSVARRLLTS